MNVSQPTREVEIFKIEADRDFVWTHPTPQPKYPDDWWTRRLKLVHPGMYVFVVNNEFVHRVIKSYTACSDNSRVYTVTMTGWLTDDLYSEWLVVKMRSARA
jgi:hypothetical protein